MAKELNKKAIVDLTWMYYLVLLLILLAYRNNSESPFLTLINMKFLFNFQESYRNIRVDCLINI